MFKQLLSIAFLFTLGVSTAFAQSQESQIRNTFADALLRAMSTDQTVRTFVQQEVMRKVDGEDAAPYALIKDKLVNGRETFAQILQRNAAKGTPDGFFANTIVASDPMLSITIPPLPTTDAGKWNTSSYVPSVGVLLNNEEIATPVNLYSSEGGVRTLGGDEVPTVPTIILQSTDRMLAFDPRTGVSPDGFSLSKFPKEVLVKYATVNGLDYYIVKYDPYTGGEEADPRGGPEGGCQRDTKTTKDECTRFKMTPGGYSHAGGHGPLRPWWLEGVFLEMQLRVFYADAGLQSINATHIYKFKDVPNTPLAFTVWSNLNAEVFHWVPDTNGDKMLYRWDEWDNGKKKEIKVSLGTKIKGVDVKLEGTFDLTNNSDQMGDSVVEYCDTANTPGYEYNTGRVRFWVRHKD